MRPLGRHLLVDLTGCDPAALDDAPRLEALLREVAEVAGSRVLDARFHRFEPQGVTGVLLLEESHLAIHTWPERGAAAVDLFSCGDGDLDAAQRTLEAGLGPAGCAAQVVVRGGGQDATSSRFTTS